MDVIQGNKLKVILSIDPVKFPLTGIGRYTYELARSLQAMRLEHLIFMRGARLQEELPTPGTNSSRIRDQVKTRFQKSRLAVAAYQWLNPRRKAQALRGLDDHLFHGPNFYLPPFAGRSVVTIHDLSPYHWAQCHPPERVRFMRAEIALSIKRASAIITDSEYTRQEVASFFNWPLDKVFAVPLASAPEFRPRTAEELLPALGLLGLEAYGYTLFTGTIEPRKNLLVLLDAYSRLPSNVRAQWPLVLTGYRGWMSEAIHKRMAEAQRQGWLRYLGYLPSEQLPLLMAGARLFAFPSLYEGFGLPVLEAMASGVPVVCSNASTLPEVAGKAAAFHDPGDVDSLARLLETGLQDEIWREQAKAAGLQRAAAFSWRQCAENTVNVYQSVLGNS